MATAAKALNGINAINSAIETITQDRAKIGAYESQFNFSSQDIATNENTGQAARHNELYSHHIPRP